MKPAGSVLLQGSTHTSQDQLQLSPFAITQLVFNFVFINVGMHEYRKLVTCTKRSAFCIYLQIWDRARIDVALPECLCVCIGFG